MRQMKKNCHIQCNFTEVFFRNISGRSQLRINELEKLHGIV